MASSSLIYSTDTSERLREMISLYKGKRVLVVTGKSSFHTSGAESMIQALFKNRDIIVSYYNDFNPNPCRDDLEKGLEEVKSFDPDLFIAVGGGSVMDMAKLLRFFNSYEGLPESGVYEKKSDKKPLIAIPTTAGTGSETTHFAVLYVNGKKYSVEHEDIIPDYAVILPELTYRNPAYITACTGFDALAQAIEAYWNKNATQESDCYAEKAVGLLYDTLKKAVISPDSDLREKMSIGSYWAGRAINITKTTAPHAFSYPFTIHYGIPHGHAVAVTFPSIAEFNIRKGKWSEEKKHMLLDMCGIDRDAMNRDGAIRSHFLNYIREIGLGVPKKEYDLPLLASGVNPSRLANNPAEIDICNILATSINE